LQAIEDLPLHRLRLLSQCSERDPARSETQNGWTIRVYRPQLLEVVGAARILDRDRFHKAVVAEFRAYLADLEKPAERDLRANLRNTLDGICTADGKAWHARGRAVPHTDACSRR
jgi:hypothetical protein